MASRFFYGWIVAAAAMLGVACSFSVLVIAVTSIFASPLMTELGWSAQQIYLGPTVAGLSVLISAPLTGALSDRLGVRRIVLWSFAIEVLLLASFKFMGASIVGYWLRYGALAILCVGTTQVVFSRMISAWFNRHLGLALGIALAGTGIGGAFWSITAQKLIEAYGWRNAYLGLAILIACISLPLLFALLRNSPASMGLSVDGAAQNPKTSAQDGLNHDLNLRAAAATSHYWLMVLVFMFVGLSLQGMQLHLVPLLTSRGASAQVAANIQALSLLAVVLGRLLSGYLLDRWYAARVAQAFLLAPIAGMSALAMGVSGGWAVISAMGVGLALGGESDVVAYLVRRYFGLRHYSRIYGTLFAAIGVGTALGPAVTAWYLGDVGGSYDWVLWTHVGVLSLVAVLLFGLKRYDRN